MRKDTNIPKNQAHQRHPAKHHQVSRLHFKKENGHSPLIQLSRCQSVSCPLRSRSKSAAFPMSGIRFLAAPVRLRILPDACAARNAF